MEWVKAELSTPGYKAWLAALAAAILGGAAILHLGGQQRGSSHRSSSGRPLPGRWWNPTNTENKSESGSDLKEPHKSNRLTLEIPRKALRFRSEDDFSRALELAASLGRGFQYNHLPESINGLPGLLLPEDSYRQFLPLLKGKVDFVEVEAIPVSGLPLAEQERIRRSGSSAPRPTPHE